MLDSGLVIEHYSGDGLKALAEAFKFIHESGVIELQIKANTWAIAEGFQDRTPEELTQAIMQVQQTNRQLLALHEWAGQFKKEVTDVEKS